MTGAPKSAGYALAAAYGEHQGWVRSGGQLFEQGEPAKGLFVIVEGWAFQYILRDDGGRQILDFALPGSVVGFSRGQDGSMLCGGEALTEISFVQIRQDTVDRLIERNARFSSLFAAASLAAVREAQDVTFEVGWRNAQEAVAHLLVRLFKRVCVAEGHGTSSSMPCPLRLEHIADALGLTSVHVCRTLKALREAGVLSLGGRRLAILDQGLIGSPVRGGARLINGDRSVSFCGGIGPIALNGR